MITRACYIRGVHARRSRVRGRLQCSVASLGTAATATVWPFVFDAKPAISLIWQSHNSCLDGSSASPIESYLATARSRYASLAKMIKTEARFGYKRGNRCGNSVCNMCTPPSIPMTRIHTHSLRIASRIDLRCRVLQLRQSCSRRPTAFLRTETMSVTNRLFGAHTSKQGTTKTHSKTRVPPAMQVNLTIHSLRYPIIATCSASTAHSVESFRIY